MSSWKPPTNPPPPPLQTGTAAATSAPFQHNVTSVSVEGRGCGIRAVCLFTSVAVKSADFPRRNTRCLSCPSHHGPLTRRPTITLFMAEFILISTCALSRRLIYRALNSGPCSSGRWTNWKSVTAGQQTVALNRRPLHTREQKRNLAQAPK